MRFELRELREAEAVFSCAIDRPSPTQVVGDGVIILHGLGEDRIGHNYIWSQMARHLASAGFTVYRCDLAGLGDSFLPLDPDLWAVQLDAVRRLVEDQGRVHVVLRGASRCIVPDDWRRGTVVALRPCGPQDIGPGFARAQERAVCGQIRPVQGEVTGEESRFWTSLGVEVRAIGGMSVSGFALSRIAAGATPCPSPWTVVAAASDSDRVPAGATLIDSSSSLFLCETDRRRLERIVTQALLKERSDVEFESAIRRR